MRSGDGGERRESGNEEMRARGRERVKVRGVTAGAEGKVAEREEERENRGERVEERICTIVPNIPPYASIYLHIPTYTFLYLHIPPCCSICTHMRPYIPYTPTYLRMSNIKNVRANMRPKNGHISGPSAFPKVRI